MLLNCRWRALVALDVCRYVNRLNGDAAQPRDAEHAQPAHVRVERTLRANQATITGGGDNAAVQPRIGAKEGSFLP
jgi:hypothetical protein